MRINHDAIRENPFDRRRAHDQSFDVQLVEYAICLRLPHDFGEGESESLLPGGGAEVEDLPTVDLELGYRAQHQVRPHSEVADDLN